MRCGFRGTENRTVSGATIVGGEPSSEGLSRRDWIRTGVIVGAAAAAGVAGVTLASSLLQPPKSLSIERQELTYTRFPEAAWWNDRADTPMRVTDFATWQGATGVFRGVFVAGKWVPGTGLPVLVIRLEREDTFFRALTDIELPPGFGLYFDDAARGIRIVAIFDRCAHLCCSPGWHVITNPPPGRDYMAPVPTYEQFGQDPVYCVCHGSQYDPMVLVKDVNPQNGIEYVGARHVHGPATRAMPVLPIRAREDDVLVGGIVDQQWYEYC